MSLLSLSNQTCIVERPTRANTASGGIVYGYATVYPERKCTRQPAQGSVVTEFAKRSIVINHTFYFDGLIQLHVDDRINQAGIYYLVKDWGDMAGRGLYTFAHVVRKDQ